MGAEKLISVVVPVYNEAENILPCLRGLWNALKDVPHEILVCYDFDGDSTLPAIEKMPDRPATLKLVKNDLGRGVAFAMKAGFQAARGDAVITTMADLSDPPEVIQAMAKKIRDEGADVVSGSRYMKGGSQTGGPLLKRTLSRIAGLSLYYIAGVGTHDATTNFRAYSAKFLKSIEIESIYGFELALELTTKAQLNGARVSEVPSTWQDRTAGESRFKLWRWMPRYLYWYWTAMAAPVFVWSVVAAMSAMLLFQILRFDSPLFYLDEREIVGHLSGQAPVTLDWLWSQHNEHRIPLPRAIYLGLSWLANGWTGLVSLAGAAAIIALTVGLVRLAGSLRGRICLWDIFLPFALLHFGHASNWIHPFQICFILFPFFLFLPLLASAREATLKGWRLGLLAAASISLPLIGGHGAIGGFAFGVWLAVNTAILWREQPRVTASALGSLLATLATFTLVALYLRGFHGNHLGDSPGLLATLHTAANFFATAISPTGGRVGSVILALLVGAGTLLAILLLLRAVWKRDRLNLALGLGAILTSVLVTGFAIGQSRAIMGSDEGSSPRYGLLAVPLIVACYLCYVRFLDARVSKLLEFGLMLLTACLLFNNNRIGREMAQLRAERERPFIAELRAGGDIDTLSTKYNGVIFTHPPSTAEALKAMKKAGIGPFR